MRESGAEQLYWHEIWRNFHAPEVVDSVPANVEVAGKTRFLDADPHRMYVFIDSTWRYWDRSGTHWVIGSGEEGVDYTLTFDGESNDGVIVWFEDESVFSFTDAVAINGNLDVTGITTLIGDFNVTGTSQLGDGGTTDYVEIQDDGDLVFAGGAGLPFGSMYNHDVPTSVDLNTSGVKVAIRVPSGFTEGQAHLTTFQNSREIRVSLGGKYLITWSISFTSDAANKEIEGFVMIDNVANMQCTAHRLIGTKTDTGVMSGTCILDLSAGAVVSLGVLNESAGGDLDVNVEHSNLSLTQIGGVT